MNKVGGIDGDTLLRTADLAARGEFRLGEARVNPGTRTVQGPGGEADLEPRVMQVLVVLADAVGAVVTRETLFDRCWGNAFVGDDSLNRAILGVRKVAEGAAAGSFAVETVPRTGYRLIVKSGVRPKLPDSNSALASRRVVIVGTAAMATIGGIGTWIWLRDRPDPRFEALMRRGKDALRLDESGAATHFEQAVAIEPHNAKAWGLLAYAHANDESFVPQSVNGQDAEAAERAARTALQIDPMEPNALLTLAFIQNDTLDWFSREERYLQILAIDPKNTLVMRSLGQMLQAVGRCGDALAFTERALSIEPLTPDSQARKAMRLWTLGRTAEADRVSDRAMQLWPSHRMVRLARMMIYAFSGRPQAALAMVEEEERRPSFLSPAAASVWRAALLALDNPMPSAVAAARKANVEGAKTAQPIAAVAIVNLSALGELDAAFDVANGFLLSRGSVIVRPRPDADAPNIATVGWRNTFGLFIPPTKPMRLDPRFDPLCDGLGLTDYWRRRGIGPDTFLFKP